MCDGGERDTGGSLDRTQCAVRGHLYDSPPPPPPSPAGTPSSSQTERPWSATRHIPLSPAPGHRVLLPVCRTLAALGAAWKRVLRLVPGTGLFPCGVCKAHPSRSQGDTPFLFQAGGDSGGVERPRFVSPAIHAGHSGFCLLAVSVGAGSGVVRGCLCLPLGLRQELGSLDHAVISHLIFRVFIVFPVLSSIVFGLLDHPASVCLSRSQR